MCSGSIPARQSVRGWRLLKNTKTTTIDEWSSLADLLANLIAKYAPVLELDERIATDGKQDIA